MLSIYFRVEGLTLAKQLKDLPKNIALWGISCSFINPLTQADDTHFRFGVQDKDESNEIISGSLYSQCVILPNPVFVKEGKIFAIANPADGDQDLHINVFFTRSDITR